MSSHSHTHIATLKISQAHITCIAAHRNFLYAASFNQINVYDLSTYTHIDTFSSDTDSGSIKCIVFHDSRIFTAHQDSKIRVWRIDSCNQHHLLSTLPTVKDRLLHFMLPKNYVRVRRHKKKLWVEHCDAVSDLVVKQGVMYSVSWDKSLKIWNARGLKCLESVKAHHDAVNAVTVSDNGVVYTGSSDGFIRVWERVDEKRRHVLVDTLEKHRSSVNTLALNGDDSLLFSGGCDRSIVVWATEVDDENNNNNRVVFSEALWGHTGAVLCLINVEDLLMSGSADRTVRIWQRGNDGYCCVSVLQGHEKPVKSLVAVERGACDGVVSICSGSLDGEVKVWDVWNSKNVRTKTISFSDGIYKS